MFYNANRSLHHNTTQIQLVLQLADMLNLDDISRSGLQHPRQIEHSVITDWAEAKLNISFTSTGGGGQGREKKRIINLWFTYKQLQDAGIVITALTKTHTIWKFSSGIMCKGPKQCKVSSCLRPGLHYISGEEGLVDSFDLWCLL